MKITKIEQQKKNSKRLTIFLDDKFWLGVSQETFACFKLKKGQIISKEKQQEIVSFEEREQAWQKALGYLSYRARSKQEIIDYLKKKDFKQKTIKKTIAKLAKYNYINDKQFVRSWILSRKSKGKGPRFIYSELIKKGFDASEIEKMIETCYNQSSQIETCLEVAKKYLKKNNFNLKNYQNKQKLFRFLGQRGFDYDIIKEVLRKYKNKEIN